MIKICLCLTDVDLRSKLDKFITGMDQFDLIIPENESELINFAKTSTLFLIDDNCIQKNDFLLNKKLDLMIRTSRSNFSYFENLKDVLHIFELFDKSLPHHISFQHYKEALLNYLEYKKTDSSKISLTKQELKVLKYKSLGLTNYDIQEKLNISENTFKGYRANAYKKINLNANGKTKLEILEYIKSFLVNHKN